MGPRTGSTLTDNRLSVDLDKILREPSDNSPTRRIYANRTLDMSEIEVIGFDMDYTLAAYQRKWTDLRLRQRWKSWWSKRYPEALRRVTLDQNFIIQGLVVDKELGNIFKMDAHARLDAIIMGILSSAEDRIAATARTHLSGHRSVSQGDTLLATKRRFWQVLSDNTKVQIRNYHGPPQATL